MKKPFTLSLICIMIGLLAVALTACGSSSSSNGVFFNRTGSALSELYATDDEEGDGSEEADSDEAGETSTEGDTEYIIQSIDMVNETITAISIDGAKQVRYSYGLSTRFLDKYGDSYSSSHFTPGQVVIFGERSELGTLTSVQMSDAVWVYEDISKYSIDEDRGVFTIGSTNYRITSSVKCFNGSDSTILSAIGGSEILQVIGKDKDIISVVITTGCGTIQLVNTDVFEDSLIFIGNKVITMVSADMEIEILEGTYDVTVANNGYGGTGTYTVTAGETTVIDLDELKGDGSSICQLTIEIDVEGASVYIDGKKVTANEVTEVAYGTHRLVVVADGYDSWAKTLVVNSSSATISLTMDESSDDDEDEEETDEEDEDEEEEEEEETTDTSDTIDAEVDYLTTLSSLITTLLDY